MSKKLVRIAMPVVILLALTAMWLTSAVIWENTRKEIPQLLQLQKTKEQSFCSAEKIQAAISSSGANVEIRSVTELIRCQQNMAFSAESQFILEDANKAIGIIRDVVEEAEAKASAAAEEAQKNANSISGNVSDGGADSSVAPVNYGTAGRLVIPDLGINVAMYTTTVYDASQSQKYVDWADAAAYMPDWGASVLVADHNYQGFSATAGAVPGKTVAYVKTEAGSKQYICTANFAGHNAGMLVDGDYRDLSGDNAGGLTLYTCMDSWKNVRITFWQPL